MRESLGEYKTRDGKASSFRKWSGVKDVIVYLHGIESHSGWFSHFASALNESGYTVYGVDRRGSGLNAEDRGDIADYNVFLDDIEDALKFIGEQNNGKKIYLMGICWGALLAVNYLAGARVKPDGLVLLSPAVYRKVTFSLCVKALARLSFLINPRICFNIPIKDSMFTPNETRLDIIRKDPLRLRSLTVRFFSEIIRMEKDLSRVSRAIDIPVAVLLAGHDEIVDNRKTEDWFTRLRTRDKAIETFEGFHHVMPFEEDIAPLTGFITEWIKERELSLEGQSIKD